MPTRSREEIGKQGLQNVFLKLTYLKQILRTLMASKILAGYFHQPQGTLQVDILDKSLHVNKHYQTD